MINNIVASGWLFYIGSILLISAPVAMVARQEPNDGWRALGAGTAIILLACIL